jgi:hypothetical protein
MLAFPDPMPIYPEIDRKSQVGSGKAATKPEKTKGKRTFLPHRITRPCISIFWNWRPSGTGPDADARLLVQKSLGHFQPPDLKQVYGLIRGNAASWAV